MTPDAEDSITSRSRRVTLLVPASPGHHVNLGKQGENLGLPAREPPKMVRAGILIDLLGTALISLFALTLLPILFGI